jgi:hypothetical protein
MFQVTIGSLGLIAFVWGPLANGGIRMGTDAWDVCTEGVERVIFF